MGRCAVNGQHLLAWGWNFAYHPASSQEHAATPQQRTAGALSWTSTNYCEKCFRLGHSRLIIQMHIHRDYSMAVDYGSCIISFAVGSEQELYIWLASAVKRVWRHFKRIFDFFSIDEALIVDAQWHAAPWQHLDQIEVSSNEDEHLTLALLSDSRFSVSLPWCLFLQIFWNTA